MVNYYCRGSDMILLDAKKYIPAIGDIVFIPFGSSRSCFIFVDPEKGEWKIISGYDNLDSCYWNHETIAMFSGIRYIGNINNILQSKELECLFK